jgi:hypothetical protein
MIAHYQELLKSNYSFWFYSRLSLPAAVMSDRELSDHSAMTADGNEKRE